MSKEDYKAKKAKEFWEYYAPMHGTVMFSPDFFLNDDCSIPKVMEAAV